MSDSISITEWVLVGINLFVWITILIAATGFIKLKERTLIGILFCIITGLVILFFIFIIYISNGLGFR